MQPSSANLQMKRLTKHKPNALTIPTNFKSQLANIQVPIGKPTIRIDSTCKHSKLIKYKKQS